MADKIINLSDYLKPSNLLSLAKGTDIKQSIQKLAELSILNSLVVISRQVLNPPSSPQNGDAYIIPSGATGSWTGKTDYVALYSTTQSGWLLFSPVKQLKAYVSDEVLDLEYSGLAWDLPSEITLANAEPLAVSSSTSGTVGTSVKIARQDHGHDLGAHNHTDLTSGGQISHASLTGLGSANTHPLSALYGSVSNAVIYDSGTSLTESSSFVWDNTNKLLDITGKIRASNQIISTLATGTSPFNITSTTVNTNLNADMLDGLHKTSFGVNLYANGNYTSLRNSDGTILTDLIVPFATSCTIADTVDNLHKTAFGANLSLSGTTLSLLNCDTSVLASVTLPTGSGTVSGTTNYIPVFTNSTTVGNSVIYQNYSNIGIGTTNINQNIKLEVKGTASGPFVESIRLATGGSYGGGVSWYVTNTYSTPASYVAGYVNAENTNNSASDGGLLRFWTANEDTSHTLTERMRINGAGTATFYGATVHSSNVYNYAGTYFGSTSNWYISTLGSNNYCLRFTGNQINNLIQGYDGSNTYQLELYTGGNCNVRLDPSGNSYVINNFGIGYTIPEHKLTVNGNIGMGAGYKFYVGYGLNSPPYIQAEWGDTNNTGMSFHTYSSGSVKTGLFLYPSGGGWMNCPNSRLSLESTDDNAYGFRLSRSGATYNGYWDIYHYLNNSYLSIHYNDAQKLILNTSGDLVIGGTLYNSDGAVHTSSDLRLKDIINDYSYGLIEICKINPINFTYKKDNPKDLPSDKIIPGIIAQDLINIIPEAITEQSDGYYSYNSSYLLYAMLNAIKELNNKIEILEAKLTQ